MSRARFLKLLRRALIGAAVVLAVLANAIGLATIVIDHARPFDWDNYVEAARRFPLGTMYNWHYPYGYHYAPQLAPVLGALSAMGITAWRVLHLAALPFLPSRKLAVLLLVSYPFWSDINTGNLMIFVLLAATWAFRGNSVATGVYLALCVLIPRPIMLPLLAWLIWQRPAWRLPFAGMAVLVVITAIPTGYLPDWIGSFVASGVRDVANDFNLSPSRFIGPAWLAIGIPLAAWLTIRGRLGWASMAISPYLLPYWVQMLGLELVRPVGQPRDLTAAPPPTGSPGMTSPPAAAPGT